MGAVKPRIVPSSSDCTQDAAGTLDWKLTLLREALADYCGVCECGCFHRLGISGLTLLRVVFGLTVCERLALAFLVLHMNMMLLSLLNPLNIFLVQLRKCISLEKAGMPM